MSFQKSCVCLRTEAGEVLCNNLLCGLCVESRTDSSRALLYLEVFIYLFSYATVWMLKRQAANRVGGEEGIFLLPAAPNHDEVHNPVYPLCGHRHDKQLRSTQGQCTRCPCVPLQTATAMMHIMFSYMHWEDIKERWTVSQHMGVTREAVRCVILLCSAVFNKIWKRNQVYFFYFGCYYWVHRLIGSWGVAQEMEWPYRHQKVPAPPCVLDTRHWTPDSSWCCVISVWMCLQLGNNRVWVCKWGNIVKWFDYR